MRAIYNLFFIPEEEFDSQGKSRFFTGLLSLLFGVLGFHRLYMKHDLRFFLILIISIALGFWCYQDNNWLYFLIWVAWFVLQGILYWIRAIIAPKNSETYDEEYSDDLQENDLFTSNLNACDLDPLEPERADSLEDSLGSLTENDEIMMMNPQNESVEFNTSDTESSKSFKWERVDLKPIGSIEQSKKHLENGLDDFEVQESSDIMANNTNNPLTNETRHSLVARSESTPTPSESFKGQNPDTLFWVEEEDEFPMNHLTEPMAMNQRESLYDEETLSEDIDSMSDLTNSFLTSEEGEKNFSAGSTIPTHSIPKKAIRQVFRSVPTLNKNEQTKVIVKSPFDQESFKAIHFDSETLEAYELYPTHIAGLKALQVSSPMWSKAQTSQTLIQHFKEMLNLTGKQLAQNLELMEEPENHYLIEFFRHQIANEKMTSVLQLFADLCENILLSNFLSIDRLSTEEDFDQLREILPDILVNQIADYYFSQIQA